MERVREPALRWPSLRRVTFQRAEDMHMASLTDRLSGVDLLKFRDINLSDHLQHDSTALSFSNAVRRSHPITIDYEYRAFPQRYQCNLLKASYWDDITRGSQRFRSLRLTFTLSVRTGLMND